MFYLVVWDIGVTNMLRLCTPIIATTSVQHPFRRASLFMIGTYAVCRSTLIICLSMLLLFCLERAYQCMKTQMVCFDDPSAMSIRSRVTGEVIEEIAPSATITWWLQWFNEDNLYRPMHPRLLPFHAGVFVLGILTAIVFAIVYPSKKDLESPESMRSTVVREVMCISMIGLIAYVCMMLACCFSTRS